MISPFMPCSLTPAGRKTYLSYNTEIAVLPACVCNQPFIYQHIDVRFLSQNFCETLLDPNRRLRHVVSSQNGCSHYYDLLACVCPTYEYVFPQLTFVYVRYDSDHCCLLSELCRHWPKTEEIECLIITGPCEQITLVFINDRFWKESAQKTDAIRIMLLAITLINCPENY